jgi:signal peptidase I
MSRTWLAVRVACAAICALMIGICAAWYASGQRLLRVQTESMRPVFAAGDAVLVEPITVAGLKLGDVIAYRDSTRPNVTVTHRLIQAHSQSRTLTTQGDANGAPDLSISEGQVIGRVTAVAPKLGLILSWLSSPMGLVFGAYLPVVVFLVYEMRRWQKHTKPKTYIFNKA